MKKLIPIILLMSFMAISINAQNYNSGTICYAVYSKETGNVVNLHTDVGMLPFGKIISLKINTNKDISYTYLMEDTGGMAIADFTFIRTNTATSYVVKEVGTNNLWFVFNKINENGTLLFLSDTTIDMGDGVTGYV